MALESYLITIDGNHKSITVDTLAQVPTAGQLVVQFDSDRPFDNDFVAAVDAIVETSRQLRRQANAT